MEHGPSIEDVITPPTAPLGLQIAASAAALGPFTGTSAAAAMPVVEAPLGVMPVVEAMPAINPDPIKIDRVMSALDPRSVCF